jgi:O-antigen/teichoic acid export membrane protein
MSENFDENNLRAENREDFLRRFFGVAVSVGFASQVAPVFSAFLDDGWPSINVLLRAMLLAMAMYVVVGSWDVYFRAIRKDPLTQWPRFAIDIIVVTFYVLLLMSSDKPRHFIAALIIIMLMYLLWDLAGLYRNDRKHYPKVISLKQLLDIYKGSLTTLMWTIISVLIGYRAAYRDAPEIATIVVLFAAYFCYRWDQNRHFRRWVRWPLALIFLVSGIVLTKLPPDRVPLDLSSPAASPSPTAVGSPPRQK